MLVISFVRSYLNLALFLWVITSIFVAALAITLASAELRQAMYDLEQFCTTTTTTTAAAAAAAAAALLRAVLYH